jgi:hypothetical protein
MPVAQEFDVPPRAFLGHVLGAVVGHVTGAAHRLDPVAAVPGEPFPPDVGAFEVFTIHPQRVNVVAVPSWVLFQGVEVRDPAQLRAHELFVAPRGRHEWRLFDGADRLLCAPRGATLEIDGPLALGLTTPGEMKTARFYKIAFGRFVRGRDGSRPRWFAF